MRRDDGPAGGEGVGGGPGGGGDDDAVGGKDAEETAVELFLSLILLDKRHIVFPILRPRLW